MKFILIAVMLMFSSVAMATDSALTVSLESERLYRGQSMSNGSVTTGATLEITDVVFNGVFMNLDFTSWSLLPVSDWTARREFGFGYASSLGNLGYALSLNRVWNPVFHATDYNEVRADFNYPLAGGLSVVTRVGQVVGGNLSKDTYLATGLNFTAFDRVDVTALVSGMRYRDLSNTRFNNAEITGSIRIFESARLFGTYSHGGTGISNNYSVGVSFTF